MTARLRAAAAALALPAAVVVLAAAPGQPFPLRSVARGEKSPAFELRRPAGGAWPSSALEGKAAVVCYYRRGQRYSRGALEALASLAERFGGRGVAFIAVRPAGDPGEPYAAESSPRLSVLEDTERRLYGAWGLFILPTTVVLDGERRVREAFASDQGDLADKTADALEDVLGLPHPPPARAPARTDAAPAAVGVARGLLATGKAREALALLEPLLSAPDNACETRLAAARAYLALRRPAEAKAQAEACAAREPASPRAALFMGRAAAGLGDERGAEEWLKKAASLAPDSAEAGFELGGLYERTGRKDEALAAYRGALGRLLRD